MSDSDFDNVNPTPTEMIYRRAFPDEPETSLLAETRRFAIDERLGLTKPAKPKEKSVVLESLKSLGFDNAMRETARDKTPGELSLLLHHANEALSEDIERGTRMPARPEAVPAPFSRRNGRSSGPNAMPAWGIGFNRALDRTNRDLSAIDAAITAVTGREPPGGHAR